MRIVENSNINDYFRAGYVKEMLALPHIVRKDIIMGPRRVRAPRRC